MGATTKGKVWTILKKGLNGKLSLKDKANKNPIMNSKKSVVKAYLIDRQTLNKKSSSKTNFLKLSPAINVISSDFPSGFQL